MKLAAKQLRASVPTKRELAKIVRREIYIVCDDVLDTYNIGSIFRLADAVAAKKIYLCKGSETPPNPRIAKASVGTDPYRIVIITDRRIEIMRETANFQDSKKSSEPRISTLVMGVRDPSKGIIVDNQYRLSFLRLGTVNESAHLKLESATPATIELFDSTGEITEILQEKLESEA